jgi:hypothetical protein
MGDVNPAGPFENEVLWPLLVWRLSEIPHFIVSFFIQVFHHYNNLINFSE